MRRAYLIPFVLALLAGCADPLAGIERLSEVELAPEAPVTSAVPPAEEVSGDGFLVRVLRRETSGGTVSQGASPSRLALLRPRGRSDHGRAPATRAVVARAAPGSSNDAARPRRGLLGLIAAAPAPTATEPSERTAAMVDPAKRRGIFAGLAASADAGADDEVPYGTKLPYGEVARVCGARHREMGRKVERAPVKGRGYTLFDSAPDTTGPRTYYVTGFSDGCPRQFTAALAVFGPPQMHEQLRYGLPSDLYPYSDTDKAYEQIKRQVCGVGRQKPCGNKIKALERRTVFISTYENFGVNARFGDILLHDGTIAATALKTP